MEPINCSTFGLKWNEKRDILRIFRRTSEGTFFHNYKKSRFIPCFFWLHKAAKTTFSYLVAYIREHIQEDAAVSFMTWKCRIGPMSQLSIPCPKLQAALLSTRLWSQILNEHDITFGEVRLWTDSVTVLHWIHSAHKNQVFCSKQLEM